MNFDTITEIDLEYIYNEIAGFSGDTRLAACCCTNGGCEYSSYSLVRDPCDHWCRNQGAYCRCWGGPRWHAHFYCGHSC